MRTENSEQLLVTSIKEDKAYTRKRLTEQNQLLKKDLLLASHDCYTLHVLASQSVRQATYFKLTENCCNSVHSYVSFWKTHLNNHTYQHYVGETRSFR